MNPARLCAVRSLVSIQKSGRYANLELDATIRKHNLSAADRALFTTLVYGVIERELLLNYYIDRFCLRKQNALSPFLRATLQIALYQLEFLDQIPTRAVLFESAEIAKISEKQSGANLVSAVLHAFLRAKESQTDLLSDLQGVEQLSVRYCIPVWMLKLWQAGYGEKQALQIAKAFSAPVTTTTLHVNTLKTTQSALLQLFQENAIAATAAAHESAVILRGPSGNLRELPGYEDGLFFVQDLSCIRAVDALALMPGMEFADVCAAPGGKSFAAACAMKDSGIIHSFDLHPNRLSLIESGARRLGIHSIRIAQADARMPKEELIGKMDRVLCDVPCSGLGILAKKPDLRHKTPDEIASLPEIQTAILDSAAQLLKAGGKLVYSTCTLNPAENESVVQTFLTRHEEFQLTAPGCNTIFPTLAEADGFFFATMEKLA